MSDEVNDKLRDALFPEGKPEPDEFISRLAELAKQIRDIQNEQK